MKLLFADLILFVACITSAMGQENPSWLLRTPLKKPVKDLVIGITQHNAGADGYGSAYEKAFRAYAQQLGVQTVVLDAQGDPTKQISQIRNLIAQRVDAMIVWPVSAKGAVPLVKQAHEAGIPVIITNSEIDASGVQYTACYSGPDVYKEGQTAGKLLGTALAGHGNVVVISGLPGYASSILREKGFSDLIQAEYPDIKILATEPGNWNREKAQSIMEDFLTRFGDKINGVYTASGDMGVGALNAIRSAGKQPNIKIVDAALFKDVYDAIKAGTYYGSVEQSPVSDAEGALRAAIEVAEGENVPKKIYFDTPPISAENIANVTAPSF